MLTTYDFTAFTVFEAVAAGSIGLLISHPRQKRFYTEEVRWWWSITVWLWAADATLTKTSPVRTR
jgi:hypothetical protein